jgi:hypothetical protein
MKPPTEKQRIYQAKTEAYNQARVTALRLEGTEKIASAIQKGKKLKKLRLPKRYRKI